MSIASAINNLKDRVENAYDALEERGAVIPNEKTTANLPDVIRTLDKAEDVDNITVTQDDIGDDGYIYIGPQTLFNNPHTQVISSPSNIYSVHCVNNMMFMTSYNPAEIYYSTNGTDFYQANTSSETTIGNKFFRKIIYSHNRYIGICPNNNKGYWVSTDGINWSEGSIDQLRIIDIATDGDRFYIALAKKVIYTTDFINWYDTNLNFENASTATNIWSIAYGNNNYIAIVKQVIGSAMVYRSSDGVSWAYLYTLGASSNTNTYDNLTYVQNKFYFTSRLLGVFYSDENGLNWTKALNKTDTYYLSDVIYNNGLFYIIQHDGTNPKGIIISYDGIEWYVYNNILLGTCGCIYDNKLYYGSRSNGSGLYYAIPNNYNSIKPFKLITPLKEVNIFVPSRGSTWTTVTSQYIGISKVTIHGPTNSINRIIDPSKNRQVLYDHSTGFIISSNKSGIFRTYKDSQYDVDFEKIDQAPDKNFRYITRLHNNRNYIFAAADDGIYWSDDENGVIWKSYDNTIARAIEFNNLALYAITDSYQLIYKSSYENSTWNNITNGTGCRCLCSYKYGLNGSQTTTIVGTLAGIKYVSNGSLVNSNITGGTVLSVYSPYYNGMDKYALAGIQNGGIFRSLDGKTWEATEITTGNFKCFLYSYSYGYFAGTTDGVYKSNDAMTWQKVSGISGNVTSLFSSYTNSHGIFKVIAQTDQGKFYYYGSPWNTLKFFEMSVDSSRNPGQICGSVNGNNSSILNRVEISPVTSNIDSNIQPENIKSGVSILDVTGTLEASNPYIIRVAELPGFQVNVTYNNQQILTDTTSEFECDLEFQLPDLGTYTITATNNVITWSKNVEITDKGVVRVKGRNLSNTSAKDIYDSCCYGISSKMFSLRDVWTFTEDPNSLYYNEKFFITEFFDNGDGTESVQFWACDDKKSPNVSFTRSQYIILSNGTEQEILRHNGYKYSHLRLDFLEKDSKIFTTISGLKFSENGKVGGIFASNELRYHNNKKCDLYSYDSISDSFTKLVNYQYNTSEPLYIEGYITPVTITETEFYNGTYYTRGYDDGNNWTGVVYNTARTYNSNVQYYGIFETLQEDGKYFREFRYLINNRYLVDCTLYQGNNSSYPQRGNIIYDKIFIPSIHELFGLKYTYSGIGNVNRTKKYFGDSYSYFNSMWTGVEYPDCFTDRSCFTRTLLNVQNSSEVIFLSNSGLLSSRSPTHGIYCRPAFRFGPNYMESESESYPESWNESYPESYPESGYESWNESIPESGNESYPESWNESYPESWNESGNESYPESWNESESEAIPEIRGISIYNDTEDTIELKIADRLYPYIYPYSYLNINPEELYYKSLIFSFNSPKHISFWDKDMNLIQSVESHISFSVDMVWHLLDTYFISIQELGEIESESWNESESYPESGNESEAESHMVMISNNTEDSITLRTAADGIGICYVGLYTDTNISSEQLDYETLIFSYNGPSKHISFLNKNGDLIHSMDVNNGYPSIDMVGNLLNTYFIDIDELQ